MNGAETGVLVVGASLAGLCAAHAAARDGAETLLIDAAPEVGSRPNPATVLMEPVWRRTGLPLPEEAIERELSGLRLGGPSGAGPLFRFRAVHLDRQAFDRAFAARATDAGATIHSGVRVDEALPSGGVGTDSGPIRARVTVFADGANSAVRRVMPTMRNPRDVAWGLDQHLEAPNIGEPPHFEVRFGGFAPGWRAQLNPLGGDRASLWTFARRVPREDLEEYARRTRRVFGLDQARILSEDRGADPAFVRPGRISGDGILACGAAAGQGGLEYGAHAGLLAGETAARAVRDGDASRDALAPYERAWKRETAMEHRVLRLGMESLWHLSDAELDATFESLSGVDLDERDLESLLRADPRRVLPKMGARRVAKLLPGLARGWSRSGLRRVRRQFE